LDVYEVENSFTVSALCARIANVAHLQQFTATDFGCSLEKLNLLLTDSTSGFEKFCHTPFLYRRFSDPNIDRKILSSIRIFC